MFCLYYLDSCSSHTWMSIYTCLHTHSRTWVVSGPVDLIPSLAACAQFHPPLLSLPAACCCSAPSGSGNRHKGCFCFEPSASLTQALSSNCQWGTQPDLSTCTDVDELRHCLDIFFSPHFLCCMCSFKNYLNNYLLCHFLCWFSVSWNSSHAMLIIIVGYKVKVYPLSLNIKQLGLWYVTFLRHKSYKLKLCFTQWLLLVW